MDKMLFKKINLLLHLAKVDGKFDSSEKRLLIEILRSQNLDESYLDSHAEEPIFLNSLAEMHGKTELFYWVLRMIKADNYLHPDELAYSKALALKLNFKPEAVDFFCENEITELADFETEVQRFRIK